MQFQGSKESRVVFSLCFVLLACDPSLSIGGERPNVVFILADDMGLGDVRSISPNSPVETVNIDRIAQAGMRFTNAHSSNAVCTPTRYSLLMGRYAWRDLGGGVVGPHGANVIDPQRNTVAEMFRQQGYSTGVIGKWHLGLTWQTTTGGPANSTGTNVDYTQPFLAGPTTHGFDYYFGDDVINLPPYSYIENDRTIGIPLPNENGQPFTIPGGSSPGFHTPGYDPIDVMPRITDTASNYIADNANQEDPFFLYFSLTAPHLPIVPPPELQGSTGTGPYGDFIATVDQSVGEVLNRLSDPNGDGNTEDSIVDNTIVVFAADNGAQIGAAFPTSPGEIDGEPMRGFKADIYEGGHRIPMLVQWPGHVEANSVSDALVDTTDFMATMSDIIGFEHDDRVGNDSVSMLPILTGQSDEGRRYAVHQSISSALAIRELDGEHEWKLAFTSDSGGFGKRTRIEPTAPITDFSTLQLFDLAVDPNESENLLADGGSEFHRETTLRLQAKLQQFIEEGTSLEERVQGDFNRNGDLDSDDIELLSAALRESRRYDVFDLDANGEVDFNDRSTWIKDVARTSFGDSNLDGVFDTNDFLIVFQIDEYEDEIDGNSTWWDGDWNGDSDFTAEDIILAFSEGGFVLQAVAVPEPQGVCSVLLLFGISSWIRRRQ